MDKLNRYVGRLVSLKQQAFERIAAYHRRHYPPENRFIVAAVGRGMRKLICYGANLRIEVSPSEVVFV